MTYTRVCTVVYVNADSVLYVLICDIIVTGEYFMSFEYAPYDIGSVVKAADIQLHILNIAVIVAQLLKALSYCHQRNIVHCSVKPSNILLTAE